MKNNRFRFRNRSKAYSADQENGDWILTDGTWDDSGIWIDTETWNDGV